MFDGINEKPLYKQQRYKPAQRLSVLSASSLLSDKRYCFYIEQIEKLADLPDDHFSHFYLSFIQRFAEFVQLIPESRNAHLGSLLTEGLLRGVNTLHVFVTQFEKPTPLERYALFTACVLRDIGSVLAQQKIFITDDEGSTLKVWQPFCGPLTEESEGRSYKIIPLGPVYERVGKSVRTMLSRQVMGENGFLWITSDLRLLAEWLEALEEDDEEGSGRLVNVIKRYRRGGGGLLDHLPVGEIEILESPATKDADAFYAWLIEEIENDNIKVNTADAYIHMTAMGVFAEIPELIKQFLHIYAIPISHMDILTQFRRMISSKLVGDQYSEVQVFSSYPEKEHGTSFSSPFVAKSHSMKNGVLISDASSVFVNGKIPDVTPHMKVSPAVKQAYRALAEFNEVMKPNTTLKSRG
jgi:hypothetical protein